MVNGLCRAGRFDSNRTVLPIFFSDEAPPLATPLPVIVKTRLIRSNGSHAVLVPWEMDLYYTSARMRAESFVAWAREPGAKAMAASAELRGVRPGDRRVASFARRPFVSEAVAFTPQPPLL